jgi:hypothetical protein
MRRVVELTNSLDMKHNPAKQERLHVSAHLYKSTRNTNRTGSELFDNTATVLMFQTISNR